MPTLTQFRQQIAQEIGSYVASAAALSGSTVNQLVDYQQIIGGSTTSPTYYDDWYIYRPTAANRFDTRRRVSSFDPASVTLYPDVAWTNAPTATEPYELHGLIDPEYQIPYLINEALKRCWITQEATLTPTPLATRHSLASLAWIDEPWKVRSVGLLASGETRSKINPYQRVVRGYVSNEAGIFYLNHPGYTFNATDTLYVWGVSAAYALCTGLLGIQNGLILEADTALPTVEWVAQGALVEAYRRFSNLLDKGSNQRLQQDRLEAAGNFTEQCRRNFVLPPLTFQPIVPLGPLPDNAWYY